MTRFQQSLVRSFVLIAVFGSGQANAAIDSNPSLEVLSEPANNDGSNGDGPNIATDDPALWGGVTQTDPATIPSEPNATDALWAARTLGIETPHGGDNRPQDDADSTLANDFEPLTLATLLVVLGFVGVGAARYRMWLQRRRWQKSAAKRRWRRRRDRVERLARQSG